MNKIKSSGELERKLSQFSEKQKEIIFSNLDEFQLTYGCNGRCNGCGAEAPKGVSDYVKFETITKIIEEYSHLFPIFSRFYGASDPFDYNFNGKSYFDVHNLYQQRTGRNPRVCTYVPKGMEKEIFKLIIKESHGFEPLINIVSITQNNYQRIENVLRNEDFLIEKMREKNFRKSPSFGAQIEKISSLNEFLGILNENCWQRRVANYYDKEKEWKLFGEEDKKILNKTGIKCTHGVLIDPKGIYNTRSTWITSEHPIGIIKEEISPEDFKVVKQTVPFSPFTEEAYGILDSAKNVHFFTEENTEVERKVVKVEF